ncbi:hypothetical protein MJO29_006335 [Puccinia striiformis f. sp. tritici]|nr:hypothetical protein MJO29_006335 [Puccinia striiformis f. sp. tritici]
MAFGGLEVNSTFNNASQENIRQNDSSCKAPHLLAPGQPPLMTSSINVTDVTPSTNTTGGTQVTDLTGGTQATDLTGGTQPTDSTGGTQAR